MAVYYNMAVAVGFSLVVDGLVLWTVNDKKYSMRIY